MNVAKIYKSNIVFAIIYFITVLLSTLLVSLYGEMNLNNMVLRIILCLFYSVVLLVLSIESYKNGKRFFDKRIESKIVKATIVFYYVYVLASCILYIYESISIHKSNGSYIMVGGAAIMLIVINQSIIRMFAKEI